MGGGVETWESKRKLGVGKRNADKKYIMKITKSYFISRNLLLHKKQRL